MSDMIKYADDSFREAQVSFNYAYNTTLTRKTLDDIGWTPLALGLQKAALGMSQLAMGMNELDAKLNAIKQKLGIP